MGSAYQCQATTLEGFIQQLVQYFTSGYVFYSTAAIPATKRGRAGAVDKKLVRKYDINISAWTRQVRRKEGRAVFQYLRYENFAVIVCTKGERQKFNAGEGKNIKDARRRPLKFAGYAVSVRVKENGKLGARVRVERDTEAMLKCHFAGLALGCSTPRLKAAIYNLPFEPYAPIRRQLLGLVRAMNRIRKAASLELLPYSCVRMQRVQVKPFEPVCAPVEVAMKKAA
jgi:hypothetical protein